MSPCFLRSIGSFVCAALLMFLPLHSSADTKLSTPTGPVILTVDGKISATNQRDTAQFDRAMLMGLGMQTLTTSNPFETGEQQFEGILFRDLLNVVGADGERIVATALDGYTIEIPIEDVRSYPVLLAMRWNGKDMTVRNKGPIWVVYPIDQFSELKDEKYSVRSIWQLTRLIIE